MASVLQRFEKRLEDVVNLAFARAFKGSVQPVEIAAGLQREINDRAQILSRERTLVPNQFTVYLAADDYDRIVPFGNTLSDELGRLVSDHVRDQRYTLTGPLKIEFERDEQLRTGRFEITSATLAGVHTPSVADQFAPSTSTSTSVELEVNGVRHRVNGSVVVIGRGTEADLRIDDPGISRRHAEVRVTGDNSAPTVTVTDLGSTNGVIVDERRVDSGVARNGSQVRLGNTVMTVRYSEER